MVTVTTTRDLSGNIYMVEVTGHAEQAKHGQDIVCSAISVLTMATLNGLTDVVKANVDYIVEEGYVKIKVDTNEMKDTIKTLLETFELGIAALLEDYGRYVKLVKKEVQPNDKNQSATFCE
ncbi:MAG: ribosomal-processing cysteine protease Prp [Peptostreptococcaceae bacterium]|nr:ribosomal-processing cysteine protease Prp [Peptostreptococcaceae bacterium]